MQAEEVILTLDEREELLEAAIERLVARGYAIARETEVTTLLVGPDGDRLLLSVDPRGVVTVSDAPRPRRLARLWRIVAGTGKGLIVLVAVLPGVLLLLLWLIVWMVGRGGGA